MNEVKILSVTSGKTVLDSDNRAFCHPISVFPAATYPIDLELCIEVHLYGTSSNASFHLALEVLDDKGNDTTSAYQWLEPIDINEAHNGEGFYVTKLLFDLKGHKFHSSGLYRIEVGLLDKDASEPDAIRYDRMSTFIIVSATWVTGENNA